MSIKDPELQKKIEELVKNSDYFIASPDIIAQMQESGEPVREVVTSYKQYLDELFAKSIPVAKMVD